MTLFEYRDMHQRPAKTGLTVGEYAGMNVCIFSELTSNPGASVTNSATQVINQVIEQRNLPDDTRFFEHYHWGDELPSVDEVVVTKKDGQVVFAEWQTMDDNFVTNMVRYITFAGIEGEYT